MKNMEMKILQTARLYLREMTPSDAEQVYLLNLDPEVIMHTGDGPFESVDAARQFLTDYDHFRNYGFGRWAVIDAANEEFLGWCGLKFTPDRDEFDIGFRFFKRHWGKGFATEAAKACIDLGFNKFQLPMIVGNVMKANLASIRVLEKIGMQFWKVSNCGGAQGLILRIFKE